MLTCMYRWMDLYLPLGNSENTHKLTWRCWPFPIQVVSFQYCFIFVQEQTFLNWFHCTAIIMIEPFYPSYFWTMKSVLHTCMLNSQCIAVSLFVKYSQFFFKGDNQDGCTRLRSRVTSLRSSLSIVCFLASFR